MTISFLSIFIHFILLIFYYIILKYICIDIIYSVIQAHINSLILLEKELEKKQVIYFDFKKKRENTFFEQKKNREYLINSIKNIFDLKEDNNKKKLTFPFKKVEVKNNNMLFNLKENIKRKIN